MRDQLIRDIEADMRHIAGGLDAQVIDAISATPRHEFVPEKLASLAYRNHPLPIGNDQTISQPFIVALMTQLLDLGDCARVLEVGTGSGYQAAVLSRLCEDVYSIEIIGELAREASARLSALGYGNVSVRHGDGMLGWPEHAPFDGIMVTAAGLEIPDRLVRQLKPGARLVIPVGPSGAVQQLKVVEATETGYAEKNIIPVRFVPVTGTVR